MVNLLTGLTPYVASFGYLLIAGFIIVEGLGVPLPGETVLIFVAAFTATGKLPLAGVVAVGALSAMTADSLGYVLGRRYGVGAFGRFHHGGDALERSRAFFARYGARAVFFARFVPVVRVFAAVLAGAGGIRYRAFITYSGLGAWTWATLMSLLGYFFGSNLALLDRIIQRVSLSLLLALAIIGGGVWLSRRWGRQELRLRPRLEALADRLRLGDLLAWLRRRFNPAERVTFLITIGFLLAFGGSWLFGGITQDVLAREEFALYDTGVSRWLLTHSTAESQGFYLAVRQLARPLVIAVGTALAGAALLLRRQGRQLLGLLLAVGGGVALSLLLEQLIRRPPPQIPGALLPGTGYSYPAATAVAAVAFYGMMAYLLVRRRDNWQIQVSLVLGAATLVVLIGLSELALGTSYMTDVVGGWAVGAAWLAVAILASELLPAAGHPGPVAPGPGPDDGRA